MAKKDHKHHNSDVSPVTTAEEPPDTGTGEEPPKLPPDTGTGEGEENEDDQGL